MHLYVQNRSPLDTKTEQRWRYDRAFITRDLAAAAGASHPLWVTEFGWTTDPADRERVDEPTQATYTKQALQVALTQWNGLVENAFLYYYGDSTDAYTAGYSALRADGSPKPVWNAVSGLLVTP